MFWGISNDLSDTQFLNAKFPILVNEPRNVISERLVQPLNALSPITLHDSGRITDSNLVLSANILLFNVST